MPFSTYVALQGIPLPPYRRELTVQVSQNIGEQTHAVAGSAFISATGNSCVAFQLPALTQTWNFKCSAGETSNSVAIYSDTVFVTTTADDAKQSGHLYALNAASGALKWKLSRQSQYGAIAVDANSVYVSLGSGTLSAIDLKTHQPRWTATLTPLKSKESFGRADLRSIKSERGIVLANFGETSFGLSCANGKVAWRIGESYMFEVGFQVVRDIALVPTSGGSIGVDIFTGHPLWQEPISIFEFAGSRSDRFVYLSSGKLAEVDPRTRKAFWSHVVGPKDTTGGAQSAAIVRSLIFAKGIDKAEIVDTRGSTLWKGDAADAWSTPLWTDGQSLVCFDSGRLIRYVHGSGTQTPNGITQRQALANSLAERWDELDTSEKKQLVDLKDAAFTPLLKLYLRTCLAYDKVGESTNSFPLYSKYHDIGGALGMVTNAAHAKELLLVSQGTNVPKSAMPLLLQLLARYGEQKDVTELFLKQLEGVRTPSYELYESNTFVARDYLITSTDPRAVDYFIRQLKDTKADETLRFEAYVHLAGTGGEKGLKAVLAERTKPSPLRPIQDRVLSGFLGAGEFSKKTKVIAEKTGADGRKWGLLESGALGNAGDLWLAEKVNNVWSSPLFTGVSTRGISRWVNPPRPDPKFAGKTAKELVSGAWFTTLVGNKELSKDSDNDGLTDIEEHRLGTNPFKADTDGDGVPDGIDPCPNAAPRPLSDAEQILAAAFEARYHFDNSEGPALLYAPKGLRPFEIVGRRGPVLWVTENPDTSKQWGLPLEQCYEYGVAFIRFSGDPRNAEKQSWDQRAIKWNKSRTEATISLSTYFGGLNGTGYSVVVRKFGNNWIVVSMHMDYVS